jgi:(1->4)-alpha-D-glucan 1-alpha-D-glucosylmutase
VPALLDAWPDGRIKLFITRAGLHLRRDLAPVFLDGNYTSVDAVNTSSPELIAFARESSAGAVVAVVPRFVGDFVVTHNMVPVGAAWGDARLVLRQGWPDLPLRNVLTGETLRLEIVSGRATLRAADVLAHCPVALLAARRT